MKTHVLDANALYRYLTNGDGAEQVEKLLEQAVAAGSVALMSVVNWGEVHYTLSRKIGIPEADAILQSLEQLPITIIDLDKQQTRSAAILKSSFGLPYADCFAAALAGRTGVLVTADTKDFNRIPWLSTLPLPAHRAKKP